MLKVHYLRLAMVAAVLHTTFVARAQELEPRAYSISPRGTNFLILGYTRFTGDVSFDPTLPIEDATSTLHTTALGYVRAIGVAGRSASIALVAPYVWGSVQGLVFGSFQQAHRSGLADPAFRFAINLHGAPAMNAAEFKNYKQKTNIGASVVVIAPLGQYDPARLLNIGTNRWAVKPEIGISQLLGRWYLDLYAGTWMFTANHSFPLGVRRQDPIGIAQSNLTCVINSRVWASLNANLYTGGRTSVAGVDHADYLHNSRMWHAFDPNDASSVHQIQWLCWCGDEHQRRLCINRSGVPIYVGRRNVSRTATPTGEGSKANPDPRRPISPPRARRTWDVRTRPRAVPAEP
jgi:hypothetical protein